MPRELKISVGQHSDKGRKPANQDFHGVLSPEEPLLGLKGIAVVLADGISSSNVSHIASESAVKRITKHQNPVSKNARKPIPSPDFLAKSNTCPDQIAASNQRLPNTSRATTAEALCAR